MQWQPIRTPKGCTLCQSDHQANFPSKLAIHPLESLDGSAKPIVWVLTQISMCLDCGHAEIRFSELRGITFNGNVRRTPHPTNSVPATGLTQRLRPITSEMLR